MKRTVLAEQWLIRDMFSIQQISTQIQNWLALGQGVLDLM